jgi:hypothetical protein
VSYTDINDYTSICKEDKWYYSENKIHGHNQLTGLKNLLMVENSTNKIIVPFDHKKEYLVYYCNENIIENIPLDSSIEYSIKKEIGYQTRNRLFSIQAHS